MLHFPFKLKSNTSARGFFGYYNLIDWWDNEFSDSDKARFREAYEKNVRQIPFENLFIGKERPLIENENQKSTIGFLNFLMNDLVTTSGYEDISQKLIEKCTRLIKPRTDALDLYFFYLYQIKLYGRLKQKDTIYELPFKKACQSQVDIL